MTSLRLRSIPCACKSKQYPGLKKHPVPYLAILHAEFLEYTAALARVKDELILHELEIRHACGAHGGVDGMCKYKREKTNQFDADAFEADHPDIHAAAFTARPKHPRITVLKARDYA